MDYDDIDYDEGYSMIDIDNNWSNSNMEYDETDSDSDSEIDDYIRRWKSGVLFQFRTLAIIWKLSQHIFWSLSTIGVVSLITTGI